MARRAVIVDTTPPPLAIGTRVKPSAYALRGRRDAYTAWISGPRRTQAKKWHDDEAAKRGTVSAHLTPADPFIARMYPNRRDLAVTWDNGGTSHCLGYMVEAVHVSDDAPCIADAYKNEATNPTCVPCKQPHNGPGGCCLTHCPACQDEHRQEQSR